MTTNGRGEAVGFLRTQFLSTVLRVFPEDRIAALDSRRTQSERSKSSPLPYLTVRSGIDLGADIHYRKQEHGRLRAGDLLQVLHASGVRDTLVTRREVVSEPPLLPSPGIVGRTALSTPEARALPYVREGNIPSYERTRIRSGVLDVSFVRTKLQGGWTKESPDPPQLRRLFRGWGPGEWARELRVVPVDGFKIEVRPFAIRTYDYVEALGPKLRSVEDIE